MNQSRMASPGDLMIQHSMPDLRDDNDLSNSQGMFISWVNRPEARRDSSVSTSRHNTEAVESSTLRSHVSSDAVERMKIQQRVRWEVTELILRELRGQAEFEFNEVIARQKTAIENQGQELVLLR